MYTLGQAAKATGKGKTTILRAIESGKITAGKNAHGHYEINPAELHRVYPPETEKEQNGDPRTNGGTAALQAELEAAKQIAEARQQLLDDQRKTIEDLRSRLDQESEERRKLSVALLSMREPPKEPEPVQPEPPRGFWARLFGT